MAILYKYMPFITDYLKRPTIKLSPPRLLNDPFESQNAQSISDYMYQKFRDEYQGSLSNGKKRTARTTKIIITRAPMRTIRQSGVFSLSESNRSLLMWAHYADQHKGIVIGLEDDFLYPENTPYIPPRLIHTPIPVKVNYDTVRFDVHEFNPLEEHFSHVTRLMAMKMLTTKSDDWLYEKEYRLIMPIAMADEIRFKGMAGDLSKDLNKHRAAGDFKIQFRHRDKLVHISPEIEMTNILYQKLSSNERFLFLKHIDPKKIHSIYFGVRARDEDIANVTSTISNNMEKLGHIKVYQYELCDKQFSLIKEPISLDYHIEDLLSR